MTELHRVKLDNGMVGFIYTPYVPKGADMPPKMALMPGGGIRIYGPDEEPPTLPEFHEPYEPQLIGQSMTITPPPPPLPSKWRTIDVEGDSSAFTWTCPECQHENRATDLFECFTSGDDVETTETCVKCDREYEIEIHGELCWNPISAKIKHLPEID